MLFAQDCSKATTYKAIKSAKRVSTFQICTLEPRRFDMSLGKKHPKIYYNNYILRSLFLYYIVA